MDKVWIVEHTYIMGHTIDHAFRTQEAAEDYIAAQGDKAQFYGFFELRVMDTADEAVLIDT